MEKVKVFQIGCGKMSKYTMRYVEEKNGVVVGAADINENVIGKKISEITGTGNSNVVVSSIKDLDKNIKKTKPDVAIITTMSTLKDIKEEVRTCVKNGVNVITTCEEAFYAKNSNPILWEEINALATLYNCTVIGCGYQDIFWGNMITSICSSTEKITKIKGVSSYNVEDYGIALAKAHGAGLSEEEFDQTIASTNDMSKEEREALMKKQEFFPSYMWNVVGWLSKKLGLNVTDIKQVCLPVKTEEELVSDTLNMTLKKGMVRGMNAVVTASTKEDIILEIMCIGKVYTKDESDINEWTIYGEPTTKVLNEAPKTVELTCACVVNRIPSVLKAKSGFLDTTELEELKYIKKDLNELLCD